MTIYIDQAEKRRIEIASEEQIPYLQIYDVFQMLEKILMLFDGQFLSIESIAMENGNSNDSENLSVCAETLIKSRLNYYFSRDFCWYPFLRLIPFQDCLNADLLTNWGILLDQMDIAYQAFLYSLSDRYTVDICLAFLVELAEPLVELIKEKTYYCQTLNPGNRGTTLKMCIDSLITHFGTKVFETELKNDYATFLDKTVASRVRIMHIRKNQTNHFDGKECIRYSMKLALLYRRILFDLLGIRYSTYEPALINAVTKIDKW